MKKQSVLFTLLMTLILAGGAAADPSAVATGPGQGIVVDNPAPDTICPGSTLKDNTDAVYENGYAWAYSGAAAPDYGAWAEGFSLSPGAGSVCGLKLALTQVGNQDGYLLDVYVWEGAGSNPSAVLSVTPGVLPGSIGFWPNITQLDVDIQDVDVPSDYFVGWWGTWPGVANGWYVAADEDGFGGGTPRTNIAPGIGFPTGWQHPNVVSTFSACQDLGIAVYESPCLPGGLGACCLPDGSCEMLLLGPCEAAGGNWNFCQPCSPDPCPPVPVGTTSWGQIKRAFR